MHQTSKQLFFVAATYGAETFKIEDGTTLSFSIDLIEANQVNAFAVVSFMPKDTPVSKLTGYSAVKDGNDFLLAKGLNKFFYDLTEGDWVDKKQTSDWKCLRPARVSRGISRPELLIWTMT